ncbi:hypothetical protein BN85305310 [Paracholeplasma brassicae]|uniref:Uncharacterized protein n=1 Tax=Acholeplasma brassicae TaxID=61635 RepID=U4KMU0_9MOLU|nr:hypothetical protein [Paracholeplasma brassicae]CCV65552.1 hypothetical protein BN85305310 [Paracholeplasma brassicae]
MSSSFRLDRLYKTISDDLRISKYEKEDDLSYKNRLVYSAIGRWVMSLFSDRDFEEDDTSKVSKSHVTITAMDVLLSYKKVDAGLEQYFTDDRALINMIEETYQRVGYVNSGAYSFKKQSKTARVAISNKCLFIDIDSNVRIRGLGLWGKCSESDTSLSDYLLVNEEAHIYTERLITLLQYNAFEDNVGKIEIYNTNKNKWEYYSSRIAYKAMYSIVRVDDGLDYKIIKHSNDIIYAASLPTLYTKQSTEFTFKHEVWRIILGICSINSRKARCNIRIVNNEAVIIKFNGFILPALEESILKCMAWPLNNCLNIFEYITDISMLKSIIVLLSRLSIEIVVEE